MTWQLVHKSVCHGHLIEVKAKDALYRAYVNGIECPRPTDKDGWYHILTATYIAQANALGQPKGDR